MTNITIYSSANSWSYQDLYTLDLDNVRLISNTATNITGYVDGLYLNVGGYFSYNAYGLSGGTVNSISLTYNGAQLMSMTGASLSVSDLVYSSAASIERAALSGSDSIVSAWTEGDIYNTYGGNDRIQLGVGDDTVDGGTGTDTFVLSTTFSASSISGYGSGIRIDSSQGLDTLRNIEIVAFQDKMVSIQTGTGSSEALNGDANSSALTDYIFGADGNDTIKGRHANDQLFGNSGDDTLFGGNGGDFLSGDAGVDKLVGGAGGDTLNAGSGNDKLQGGNGGDKLYGGNGKDNLLGNGGADKLFAGGGNDRIEGGAGNDKLTGGNGVDDFVFKNGFGKDIITDFNAFNGNEDIDLSGVGQIKGWTDLIRNHMEQADNGVDVIISQGKNMITLEGVDIDDLGANDFLF